MRHKILFLAILSLNVGCETLLDKEPLAVVSENSAYQSESDAMKALTSVYNTLLNYPGYDGYSIYDIAADNAEKGGEGPSDGGYFNEIAYFTLTSSNTVALQVWRNAYLGIRRANLVIENVPGIEMDQHNKERIVAEAKFLRAYNYAILVTLYGDVPLITQVEYERDKVVRESKEIVYEQIISDLQDAAGSLPFRTELAPDELGRVTKGAAQAYLGKVFLYRGDFQQAENWFETVIESNQYHLEPDYYKIFTVA